jgi:tetratricopeptide (TPR) repeat protein
VADHSRYYHECGRSIQSPAFYDMAESICESVKERLATSGAVNTVNGQPSLVQLNAVIAEIQHNHGCIDTETNQPDAALRHHGKFNAMMKEEFAGRESGDDMRLAIAWNQYGNAMMINKRWKDAEDCYVEAMRTMKLVNGSKEVSNSFAKVNLGLAYWLTGRLNEAEAILIEGLQDRRDALGPNDRDSFM